MDVLSMFAEIASRTPSAKATEQRRRAAVAHKAAERENAGRNFLERNAELFAAFNQPQDVDRKLTAYMRLRDPKEIARLMNHSLPALVRAGQLGDAALLSLIENGAISFALDPLPREAEEALASLKRRVVESGLRPPTTLPPMAATAEAAEPTDAELDGQAVAYYNAHSVPDVKARMRHEPDFAARVIKLQEANRV